MPRTRWPLGDVDDHNGPQWITVRYCGLLRGHTHVRGGDKRRVLLKPGWYVVRTCPCHWGERVTLPYFSQARAEHARNVMLRLEALHAEH